MSAATEERLIQEIAKEAVHARLTADALGAAIHAAHTHASPALAAATQARENLYDRIEAEFGMLTSAQAGEAMGSRSKATRNLALNAQRQGVLLGVRRGRYTLYPGFQFDAQGVRKVIADLIAVGNRYGRTEAGLIQWLMSPTTYLGGKRPVDIIDEPDQLLAAAESSFGVEW